MTLLNKTEQKGFTLLELMLVVAIIGILSAIAIPSYYSTIEKSRRSDAMDAVLDCAAAQARNFSSESPSSYLDQADAVATGGGPRYCGSDGTNLNSKEGFYRLTILNINPNPCTTSAGSFWCFEVEARPLAGGPQANDEDCQVFRVDHRGNRTAEGTGITDDEAQDICWRS